jgi:hypothetical protein
LRIILAEEKAGKIASACFMEGQQRRIGWRYGMIAMQTTEPPERRPSKGAWRMYSFMGAVPMS